MTTTTQKPGAAANRPLALRMRSDLVVVPQVVAGRRSWAVKDPVALELMRGLKRMLDPKGILNPGKVL